MNFTWGILTIAPAGRMMDGGKGGTYMDTKMFLIVVDMQKDFIDGSLGTPEAQRIVPAVCERIENAQRDGETVIATLDTHGEDYMATREGRFLPVMHCIKGTEGWRLHGEVDRALGGCPRLEKPTFGSVELPGIIESLSGGAHMEIELLGLCTDICVVSNALLLKAHFPEADIRVSSSLCAGVTPEKHQAALETMRSCQIEVL